MAAARERTVRISLRRLAVFKAVIDRGGVNAAADYLGISQPSVTAHLKALELQIGEPLFIRYRGRRHVQTTAAGELLERYASDALLKAEELEQSLSLARAADARTLRIAAQRILANNEVSAILADVMKQDPQIRITLHSETQEVVRRLFVSGEADLAFLFAGEQADDASPELIGFKRLGFIASPAHPLASRRSIEPPELSEWPFVGGLRESEYFGLVREAAARIGVEGMRFILHLQDSTAVQRAVAGNAGIACTIVSAVRDELLQGRLVVLPVLGKQPRLAIRCLNRTRGSVLRSLAESLVVGLRVKWAAEHEHFPSSRSGSAL